MKKKMVECNWVQVGGYSGIYVVVPSKTTYEREYHECECGAEIAKGKGQRNLNEHRKSQKHKKIMMEVKKNKKLFQEVLEEIEMLKTINTCLAGS